MARDWIIVPTLVCFALWPCRCCGEATKRPFTVTDSIEATRVLDTSGTGPLLISPSGKRYLIVLMGGDVKRNGSWVELLSGSTASLEAAAKAHIVARLFTKSTARDRDLIKNVHWLGDEQIAFLWDDGRNVPQIIAVELRSQQMRKLRKTPTPPNPPSTPAGTNCES